MSVMSQLHPPPAAYHLCQLWCCGSILCLVIITYAACILLTTTVAIDLVNQLMQMAFVRMA